MTRIVDASVALKWVIEEDGSALARRLIEHENLAAPDLLWIECANVLWTKARRGQISVDEAKAALAAIDAAPVRTLAGRPLALAAQAIAVELNQSAYDSLYLAAAIAERSVLVTADDRFARAAMTHATYRQHVERLGS